MPVIYNKKVEYAYTDPGVKAHTLSWAEYQALSEDDKMNGDLYFIPDKQPEGNPSRIWTKLGTDPLTTQADDVSGAVNELNSSLTNFKTTKQILYTNGAFVANTPRTFTLTETYNNFLMLCIAVTQYGNLLETMTIPVLYFNNTSSGNRPILHSDALNTNVDVYKNDANSVIVRTSNALTDIYHVSIYGVNRIV